MSASGARGRSRCPVCDSAVRIDCIRIHQVLVYRRVLHGSREPALNAPKCDMDPHSCSQCGHLFNAVLDPARVDYSSEHESSLHFPGRFRERAQALAEHRTEQHGMRGKTIIEIACGQEDILGLLCSMGGNRGIGLYPSHVNPRNADEIRSDLQTLGLAPEIPVDALQ